MHSANPPVQPRNAPVAVTQRTTDCPSSSVGSNERASEVTMITNRSNHMPMFTKMQMTNMSSMLRRTDFIHSSSGMITLQVNMIAVAHQKCPVKRHQKMSRSYLLGPYQAQKN